MDNVEELVGFYLRLNGFFTVSNFLVHDPSWRTDVDVFGVRFPHKLEVVKGGLLLDDPGLELRKNKVEVVLGEVGRTKYKFNDTWCKPERMAYFVSFLGWFSDSQKVEEVSCKLARLQPYEDEEVRIRPVLFSGGDVQRSETQYPLDAVIRFVVERLKENETYKKYRPMWKDTFAEHLCHLVERRARVGTVTLQDIEGISRCCRTAP